MIDKPQVVESRAQHVASIRLMVPRDQIVQVMRPGIEEVMAAIAAQGLEATGAWLAHHFQVPSDVFDFEICVPVPFPVKPAGRVQPAQLRAARVARTVYRGGYEGLGAAWGEFAAWIKAHGHHSAPDLWECYVKGPESGADPSQYETQLNQPLVG